MSKRSFLLLLWGSILFLAAELLFALPVDQDPDLVLRVQQALQSRGYDPGPADGVVGPQTREALRRFQQDQELKVTGIPDEPTLDRLRVDGDGLLQNAGKALAAAGKGTARAGNAVADASVTAAEAVAAGATIAAKRTAEGVEEAVEETEDFMRGQDIDDRIEAELRQKWEQNSRINPDNLEVESRDGVVHLTFKGDDPTEFTLAVREARTVPGVKKIVVRYTG